MILKSFYRKKITKTYLIIITLILLFLLILIYNRSKYLANGNAKFQDSYILFASEDDVTKDLLKINNVKEVRKGIASNKNLANHIKDGAIYYFANPNLQGNEIMIYDFISDYFNEVNNTIYVPFKNDILEFNISSYLDKNDYISSNYLNTYVYISNEMYDELASKREYFIYYVKLDKWFEHKKIEKEILKKINVSKFDYQKDDEMVFGICSGMPNEPIMCGKDIGPSIYLNYIIVFNIITVIFGIIFLIILVVTIHNIILDEEKNNYLYTCIGFNKQKIKLNNLFKILSLIFISIALAFLVLFIYLILF